MISFTFFELMLTFHSALNDRDGIKRMNDNDDASSDSTLENGQAPTNPAFEVLIAKNTATDAPNISLNSHKYRGRRELRIVAALGTVLQLGVLVFSGFATHYPTLGFPKDGHPVAGYAFPCTVTGTVCLVLGMLVCSHVVESSTQETNYRTGRGKQARMVWLQKTQTVNDQVFESFAIFPRDARTVFTVSSRMDKTDPPRDTAKNNQPRSSSSSSPADERDEATSEKLYGVALAIKAVIGTGLAMIGFVVQFIGLRGMHWSASIAQLGAVLTMMILKAWVRRGLAEPPRCIPLTPGFELEWFASTLGDIDNAPWRAPSRPKGEDRNDSSNTSGSDGDFGCHDNWRVVTGESPEIHEKLGQAVEDGTSKAHMVMMIRRDLGELADWRGPASAEAISLTRAIEVTMDALFKSSPHGNLTWSLKVGPSAQPVYFRLRQQNGSWKAYADEIEAALSLWLYSAREQERGQQRKPQEIRGSRGTFTPKADEWFRAKGLSAKRSLRLLGPYTPQLHRDLSWWMPRNTARIVAVEKDASGTLELENHRIVGCGPTSNDVTQTVGNQTRYRSLELKKLSFSLDDKRDLEKGIYSGLLATESHQPLKMLYSQDMFSAFMWAAAKAMPDPIQDGAEIQPTGSDGWQLFTLHNDHLSRMAQDIQSTGLASLEDIYLSIIPPLSAQQKLPQVDAIIELARLHAKGQEQLRYWEVAGEAYFWLLRVVKTFPKKSRIVSRATAVSVEYLRMITALADLREAQQYGDGDIVQLRQLESALRQELKTADPETLSGLMRLYRTQNRGWKSHLVQQPESAAEGDDAWYPSFPETFGFKTVHRGAQNNWDLNDIDGCLEGPGDRDRKDIHDWTPLHYASAAGSQRSLRELLSRGARVNGRDLVEWTPLHYACQRGNVSAVQYLFQRNAELDARGRDGAAPLHCAAMNGHLDIVRLLLEAGAAPDVTDASGNTPLHWATYEGHENVVEYLWQDANRKMRDYNGRVALHLAAVAGKTKLTKLLIATGADKEVKDRNGQRPLHLAVKAGNEATSKLLIDEGANKEARNINAYSPLHLAAEGGQEATSKLLLDEGANKEAKDINGFTPLHLAAKAGHEAISRLLVDRGADKEAKPISSILGPTPLHLAATAGHEGVSKLLIGQGAYIEGQDDNGRTPLHLAAWGGHEALVRLLLAEGADKNAKCCKGPELIHQFDHRPYSNSAENGAKNNIKWYTPLDYAASRGHELIVKLLE